MTDAKLMSNARLLEACVDLTAKIQALGFCDLIDSHEAELKRLLTERKQELLSRMDGNGDVSLLQELLNARVESAISGEEKSPELRATLDRLEVLVLGPTAQAGPALQTV
jgi:hypothetical protein